MIFKHSSSWSYVKLFFKMNKIYNLIDLIKNFFFPYGFLFLVDFINYNHLRSNLIDSTDITLIFIFILDEKGKFFFLKKKFFLCKKPFFPTPGVKKSMHFYYAGVGMQYFFQPQKNQINAFLIDSAMVRNFFVKKNFQP